MKNWRLFLLYFFIILCLTACVAELAENPTPVANIVPSEEESVVNEVIPTATSTKQPEETAVSTPTPAPSPTGIFIYDEPIVFERLDSLDPLPFNLDAANGLIAYQQNGRTWLDEADGTDAPVEVPVCPPTDDSRACAPQVHWSPDGTHFFYETAVSSRYILIISDLQGNQQGFTISMQPYRTPVWSQDGRQIILFVGTNRPWGDHFNGDISANELGFLDEVWQLQLDASGTWLPPQKLTELETPGIGCGGGGYSVSDYLYESQGGFTMGLTAAQKMFWTTDDVIIYHLSCDYYLAQGYGRYDIKTNQQLDPYSGRLHGLVLDASGSRWYAITGQEDGEDAPMANRLVTGTVNELGVEVVETAVSVEMVFVGKYSGRLYYTSREQTDRIDISHISQNSFESPPYFHFYRSQLWTIQPDGSDERLLWESDDHSYSRFTETPDGDLLFVLIENDVARFEALTSDVPEAEWPDHFPHTHIMRLSPNALEPEIYIEDARDLAVWFP